MREDEPSVEPSTRELRGSDRALNRRALDAQLARFEPFLPVTLAIQGAIALASAPLLGSSERIVGWVLLGLNAVLGLTGFLGWRGDRAAVSRAMVLSVSAGVLAFLHEGPLGPFGAWWGPIVVVYGLLLTAELGLGITVVACASYVALLGVPDVDVSPPAFGRLGLVAMLGWLVWRAASVYDEAVATNRRLALSDSLTGLPNRAVLADRLNGALQRAKRHPASTALMFLDLDDFKVVNDSLGHEVGDELLQQVASRLSRSVRPSDTVARFGGDEFIVLCEDVGGPLGAMSVADRIVDRLSEPLVLHGQHLSMSASIGIALHTGGPTSGDDLLRDADAAMYRAKHRGGGTYELFDTAIRDAAQARLTMESALRRALANDEFRLVYQPQVRLSDGLTVGYEALIRWQPVNGGPLVPPSDFVPLAEETGLIVPIGEWVLNEACNHAAHLRDQGNDGWISVNVSARQFSDPALCERVERALENAGIAPSALCLEITETAAMPDMERAVEVLADLRDLGLEIHIDDFGTGYSSMSQLRRFPVTALKVDKSFVAEMTSSATGAAIPTAIITLAHSLGLTAVAEGVESAEQLAALRELGCDVAQGFYLGTPERHGAAMHSTVAEALSRGLRTSDRTVELLTRLREEREHHG